MRSLLPALLLASSSSSPVIATPPPTHAAVFEPSRLRLVHDAAAAVEAAAEAPPPFDFYVLAESWQPEFCHGKETEYPGCRRPMAYWRSHFTLHGLWPELERGRHPGFCGGPAFDPAAIEAAIGLATLVEFWPDVKIAAGSSAYPEFWKHEWTRHGTCSGLDQVTYFAGAVGLLRNASGAATPALIQAHVGASVPADDVRGAFAFAAVDGVGASAVALKCDHGDVLSQVFSCWDKDARGRVTRRRPCPAHILQEDTCTETTLFIPAFAASS